ncbi:MAG: hypothetical protein ACRDYB_08120 [Acidimicrobiales bacterium]
MYRLPRILRPRRRVLLVATGAFVAVLALGAAGHPTHTPVNQPTALGSPAVVLAADHTPAPTTAPSPTTTVPPGYSGSGAGPTRIEVGPGGTTTPSTPTPGSGGSVSGGSQPSPGLFDITGHITAAIDSWFRDLVTAALEPILTLLGHTLLATPNVTVQSRVGQLWRMTEGIADAFLVLFVLVGGAIVMGHETVQTRTAIKDILPRIIVAGIAVNASLSLAGLVISTADSLSQAVMGQGVDPSQAAVVLRQLVLGSLASGGIFVVLVGGVVAVLAMVVLATYVVRLAVVILLVVAAPICLVCHALPQTEGLAKLWWRAFIGALAVQVAQSLVLITALRVFLATGGPANLGIASTGGLVDLLVSACLCWVLVKIPGWVSRFVFSGSRGHSGVGRVVRDVIVYKGAKALAAGVGL